MLRADFSDKPNARAYKALVLDEWRTRATGSTDEQGVWRGRGFHGDYVVTVEQAGERYEQMFTLMPGAVPAAVRVPLAAPRFVNLSTRAVAGTADATLIPGFVVGGTGVTRVLVRGIGPGLGGFGIDGVLARPELTLYRADGTVVGSNRGWDADGNGPGIAFETARAGAFPLAAGSRDCALLVSLPPGGYTAPVSTTDGGSGIALVEAYDLDGGARGRFRDLSARARVGSGEAVAISGLVIAGDNARTVLVRAVGPGLAAFGMAGGLSRPSILILSGSQPVAANAGWESSSAPADLAAASLRAGTFPLRSGQADAALMATLPAGTWTIQVAGADGGAGVVLVEVYDLSG